MEFGALNGFWSLEAVQGNMDCDQGHKTTLGVHFMVAKIQAMLSLAENTIMSLQRDKRYYITTNENEAFGTNIDSFMKYRGD
jgi:hypothetical protein